MKNRKMLVILASSIVLIIGSLISLGRPVRSLSELENKLGTNLDSTRKNVAVEFESSAGTSGVIRIDNDGDIQLVLTLSDERAEFRRVDDIDYFDNLSEGGWATYPEGANLIETTQSTIALEGISDEEAVIELDSADCSTGTCRVYEITRTDDSITTVRIDAKSGNISELEGEVDGNSVKFTYLERDPSTDIKAPADFVQTLDEPDAS